MGSYYRQQLEDWLKTRDVKCGVLYDIGGRQNPLKTFYPSGQVIRTKSYDVEETHILDLPEYNLDEVTSTDQGEFMPEGWVELANEADIIFCLEVFEYLIRPLTAMKKIKHLLKPGGRAYVTFQFVYPHHNELEFDSLRYTESGVRRLAQAVGLTIENIWYRTDRSGLLKAFYSNDGMRAAKQYPHHDATGFIVELVK